MTSSGRLWGRHANVDSPASGSGPTAGWHTLERVWDLAVLAELLPAAEAGFVEALCAEQSLKRIETAGEKASGGLKGLGRQAELLRTGIRTLGGALIGAATVGGLGALVDRSISAADAIGKTADKIGVGVEALQELRFAAKASGVEQQTLDMALQRFTRRAAEAAQGTGEAKDALAQMGITLRDQSGNLRQSEPARRRRRGHLPWLPARPRKRPGTQLPRCAELSRPRLLRRREWLGTPWHHQGRLKAWPWTAAGRSWASVGSSGSWT
jgi:hypothetical protein